MRKRRESLDELKDRFRGKVVNKRYRIDEFIDAGGMSYVFKGTHLALDCDIAIKFLQKEHANNEGVLTRFQRESMALARIRHPNVVTVYDQGVWRMQEKWHFFVMEYLEGKTLVDIIDDPDIEYLELEAACSIVAQVLRALQAIHGCKDEKLGDVVHRDLKPGNIKLIGEGYPFMVKVLDMGIAHFGSGEFSLSSVTYHGRVFGTPHFMAPEQARADHDAVNRTTDIYATGAILFNILTKRQPYEDVAKTMAEVLTAQIKESPPKPSDFRGGLPPEIDAIVQKAMAKEQKDRFQSADEMREALGDLARKYLRPGFNLTGPSLKSKARSSDALTKEFSMEPKVDERGPTLLSNPGLPPAKRPSGKKRFPRWRVGILFLVLGVLTVTFLYMRHIESRLPKPDSRASQSDGSSEAEEAKVDQKVVVSEDAVISVPEEPPVVSDAEKAQVSLVTESDLSPTAKMVWDSIEKGRCSRKNMAAAEKTVANYPGFAQGHKWLGKCYRKRGKSAQAFKHEQLYEQLR